MRFMVALAVSALLLVGCNAAPGASPSVVPSELDPVEQVSCGGHGFPAALLEEPGSAETSDDPAAEVGGWGQCRLQADVGPQLGWASFRVDPATELGPLLTEIPVLVTERACNSGEDARGRIADPTILLTDAAVTVAFAVRPRDGGHDCPSNPETPHLLRLPEPLGDRSLFDGSEVPPRDATLCAEHGICPP